MQEKDKHSIHYLSDPTKIADLLNTYLYHGKQLLTSDNIRERARDSFADETKEKKTAIKMITRDIVKEIQTEAQVILIAFENHSRIHYAMPLRIMRGDAFHYQEQGTKIAKEHRLNLLEVNTFSNIEQLRSDLRFVFGFLQRRNDGSALKSYVEENQRNRIYFK